MRHAVLAYLAILLVACQPPPTATPSSSGVLEVRALAGPVCPVERQPPDPACESRPVAGAPILVQPGDGRDTVVAAASTDDEGRARIELAPGAYVVVAGAVEGLFGRPEAVGVTVVAGESVDLTLAYDTGIR